MISSRPPSDEEKEREKKRNLIHIKLFHAKHDFQRDLFQIFEEIIKMFIEVIKTNSTDDVHHNVNHQCKNGSSIIFVRITKI